MTRRSPGRLCLRSVDRRVRSGGAARRRPRPILGKGVEKAVTTVLDEIGVELLGFEASEQRLIDQAILDLDGTPNKERLGANAVLGVSPLPPKRGGLRGTAVVPLRRRTIAHLLPVPMLNILNGGARGQQRLDIQEFMVAPIGAAPSVRPSVGRKPTTRPSRS